MRNERRNARRGDSTDNQESPGLGIQLSSSRSRITSGSASAGLTSPTAFSTPPGGKRLHNTSNNQHTGQYAPVNFNNSATPSVENVTRPPLRAQKTPAIAHDYGDEDMMHNRLSMDSIASTVTNSTVTGDGHDEAGRHGWTEDQIAVIVRTLEEGNPPAKVELKNARLYAQMTRQPNPDSSSSFKFLASWNNPRPLPPTTPYLLPHVPPNLIDHWARELKKNTDWPHDTRAIRAMLRTMAEEIAKDEGESPRKLAARRMRSREGLGGSGEFESLLIGRPHENASIEEEDMQYDRGRAEETDDLLASLAPDPRPSLGRRDDARVYRSSLAFQRNEDNIDYKPFVPSRSIAYTRARSPTNLRSPSPVGSFTREATISPTNSTFSFNSGCGDGISPTKSTFGISPEKTSIGKAMGQFLSRSGRSRSISPSPTKSRNSTFGRTGGAGKDKPHPPLPSQQLLQTPSLSPMSLTQKDAPMSIFQSGSLRRGSAQDIVLESGSVRRIPTPTTVNDLTDLNASLEGGRRDGMDGGRRENNALLGGKTGRGKRAPIPFFTRDTMREEQGRQARAPLLPNDAFFSAGADDDAQPLTISSATGSGVQFSSISSISSLFSNGSMRKVLGGLSSKSSAGDMNVNASSNNNSAQAASTPPLQSVGRDWSGVTSVQAGNRNFPVPALSLPPHLIEEKGHAGRNGIKRSASFSRPAERIKRAPSYGGPKGRPPSQMQEIEPVAPEAPSKTPEPADHTRHTRRRRHKRERSDDSLEFDGSGTGTGSEYDTEDVPPSSAPSSDRITQVSPLKPAHTLFPWDSSPSPEKVTSTYPASPRMLSSPSKSRFLASPNLLPGRFFGRTKSKSRAKEGSVEAGSLSGSGSGSVSPSPIRDGTISPGPYPEDDAMDIDVDHSATPAQHNQNQFTTDVVGMAISPTDTASPMGGITPRPRVTSTPRAIMRKASTEWGRYGSPELRSIRQSPIEERREGEPRRKRVKTDELESPPRLKSGPLGYNTRAGSASRTLSPRAMSDGPARTFYKHSAASKTPPRRTGMPRSPRLLPGGGRMTPTRSPKGSGMRLRARSSQATPQARIPQAFSDSPGDSNMATTPDFAGTKVKVSSSTPARGNLMRPIAQAATAATISSASKARRPATEATPKPATSTTNRPGKAATSSRNAPKREPSFFGAELMPKPQQSGTTRFPTASTASISSVLFPGGVPPESSTSNAGDEQMFDGIGSGEEGVIRAGESAASSRRAGDMGKTREALRSGLGGSGRSRMTRSVSMLGPGDRQRPY